MARTRSFNGIPLQLKPLILDSVKQREHDYLILEETKVDIVDTSDKTFNRRHKEVTHPCICVIFTGSPEGLQRATSWIRAAINIWLRDISPPFLSQPLSGVFVGIDNKLMVDWRTAMGI